MVIRARIEGRVRTAIGGQAGKVAMGLSVYGGEIATDKDGAIGLQRNGPDVIIQIAGEICVI